MGHFSMWPFNLNKPTRLVNLFQTAQPTEFAFFEPPLSISSPYFMTGIFGGHASFFYLQSNGPLPAAGNILQNPTGNSTGTRCKWWPCSTYSSCSWERNWSPYILWTPRQTKVDEKGPEHGGLGRWVSWIKLWHVGLFSDRSYPPQN